MLTENANSSRKIEIACLINNAEQMAPPLALKMLLGILDGGYDSSSLRLALAKTYLNLNLPTQAREFLKTVHHEGKEEALKQLSMIHPYPDFILPATATLSEHNVVDQNSSSWVIASAASSSHFPQLINLIGSLHRHCLLKIWKIIVYDLGMTTDQIKYLNDLALVKVKIVPDFQPHSQVWWTWKIWILKDCAEQETVGPFMYFDAGTVVQSDLTPIFELILKDGYALWHAGGHLNKEWTTTAVYEHLGLGKESCTSLQMLATVQGYAARGVVRTKLVDAAYEACKDERLLRPSADCPNNRHDQSLLSMIIQINNITLRDPSPHIAWENSNHDSAIIWLCRARGIMGHNEYLRKKHIHAEDISKEFQMAAAKAKDSKAETIAKGEELLFALSCTDAAILANDLLKQNVISGALHNDILFQSLLDLIVREFEPEYLIETGTFLAWTTSYLAQNYNKLKIITLDSNINFNKVASNRLSSHSNVEPILKSSELFLKGWLPPAPSLSKHIFFLDAHWESYWPLPEELKSISESNGPAVIIIDDFMVPDKPEYGYDDYGNGKAINLANISPNLAAGNSYKCLLPNYSQKVQASICQHLRGRLVIFQNSDDVFNSLRNDPWVSGNFSDGSEALNQLIKRDVPKPKIVALMPVKNEANCLEFFLRSIAKFADAICIYDDASTDETVSIVNRLADECHIERILINKDWEYNETNYRQPLLDAGRDIGGTHFIIIDADEAFTANLLSDNVLREAILKLQPGDQLSFAWIQLWRSTEKYRNDKSVWTNNYKGIIFCDDGKCSYHSQIFHLHRVPTNLVGRHFTIEGYRYGLLHFQYVNWRNLLIKQSWYRCLERIRDPQKQPDTINRLYAPSKDETDLGLVAVPDEWLDKYDFFDAIIFAKNEKWREKQVLTWFAEYGMNFFAKLDIWDIEWGATKRQNGVLDDLCASPQTQAEVKMIAATEPIGGWFSTEEILSLYRLVSPLPNSAKVLEIGSYRGRSTNAIGYAMEGSAMELYCIDIWRDFITQGIRQVDSTADTLPPTDFAIFEDYLRNIEKFGSRVRTLRGSTQQLTNLLPKDFFDLIFVDGAHDYENVFRDISAALMWVKNGGILCGHDYRPSAEDVIRAVEGLIFSDNRLVEHGVIQGTSIWYARFSDPQRPCPAEDFRNENTGQTDMLHIKSMVQDENYTGAIKSCLAALKINSANEEMQNVLISIKHKMWEMSTK